MKHYDQKQEQYCPKQLNIRRDSPRNENIFIRLNLRRRRPSLSRWIAYRNDAGNKNHARSNNYVIL